jgi:hypothetical protein
MKIQQAHYNQLKQKVYEFLDKNPAIDYNQGLTSMRYRWDIYWNCGGSFSNAQEYNYLDDNNIDTALKHILKARQSMPKKPALYEPYEPLDGLDVEINISEFQNRLNHIG